MITRRHLLAGAALLVAGCTADPSVQSPGPLPPEQSLPPRLDPKRHAVLSKTPASDSVVPPDAAGALVASRAVLAAATVVVVATQEAAEAAFPVARALGVPLLVDSAEVPAELDRLQTRTVLAYGEPTHVGEREVIAGPATAAEVTLDGLPLTPGSAPALALRLGDAHVAVIATLAAAGVQPTDLPAPHPGSTKASTDAVRAHRGPVLGIGEDLGTDGQFADAVAVTRQAPLMPGGSVAPLPGHHMIALYGHPETPALGMMGEQPPAQAVQRLGKLLDEYRAVMPDKQVLGAFEIITTVASASAGDDGDYSYETPAELILPWIEAAEANDFYVVLDLQPGRTAFIEQARRYADLLRRPHVGLALDPEWRLGPTGRHLRQIGQVQVEEVNEVGAWLADFVREHRLPPKVFTLHQFQVRMIPGRARLDTSRPEVQHLVHVDGQGGQGAKQATWGVIKKDLPAHTWLGWKNFEHEDKPMLSPRQTVEQVKPTPHFISYQ